MDRIIPCLAAKRDDVVVRCEIIVELMCSHRRRVTGRVGEVKSRAKNNVLDRGIRLAEKQKEALSELKD